MKISALAGKPPMPGMLVDMARLVTAYCGALTHEFGEPVYDRVEAPATPDQQARLARLSPQQVTSVELAGEPIQTILTRAPGNDAPIGGLKVIARSGWLAARPSGTEAIYKIYAESFRGQDHLHRILEEAQVMVDEALATIAERGSRGASPDGTS